MEEVTNLSDLLQYILTGGALVVSNFFVSWFFEGFEFWKKLSGKLKSSIVFLLASGVGVFAQWLILNPEASEPILPYINTVIVIGGGWVVTQVAHFLNPKRKENNGG